MMLIAGAAARRLIVTYASLRPESLPPVARFAGRTMSSCQKLESMGGNAICWIDRHGPIRDDASVVCMVPVDSLLSESRLNEAVLPSVDFSRFVPSLLGGNNRLDPSSSFLALQALLIVSRHQAPVKRSLAPVRIRT